MSWDGIFLDLYGTITPSDLHYERHHGGVAVVDPRSYTLLIHGLVERPTIFTLDELKLAVGQMAYAVIKASSVMIGVD